MTEQLEEEIAPAAPARKEPPVVNRRPWPWAAPDSAPLPPTLPGGKPWPKISVITPAYNHGKYIEQTILSVINQAYPNLEYLVIDGGSKDETVSIVEKYRDRIDYFVSEKDRGQSNAINKGFARATGEILTWLNSDDLLEPDALAAVALAFHVSGADMVAGICSQFIGDLKIVRRDMTSCGDGVLPIDQILDIEGCWLRGQFFHQPEVMFTRDLWERAGSHVDESLFYSMDYELWLRFAEQRARLHPIGRSLCLYRVHEDQKSFSVDKFKPELLQVRDSYLKKHDRALTTHGPEVHKIPHLRIVMFNDLGGVGGAGIGHQRLATALSMAGHDVMPLAIMPDLVSSQLTTDKILAAIDETKPNLVVVGNIHAARLDPSVLGLIAKRWPTIQVLHDFYSLTGRCAYPGDCEKYSTGCDHSCPTSHEYPILEPKLIRPAWETKNAAFISDRAPILATVSDWAVQTVNKRFDKGPRVISLRNGVPTEIFKPRDKTMCRELLGLPQDRFIVLFSASHLSDRRKGLHHLMEALAELGLPDLLAVCIGHFDQPPEARGFEIRSMGFVGDPLSLARLYSAADLFVGPSLMETFGQVFVESAACGTPSIGYADAGGVAEAVSDGLSGCLASPTDSRSLAKCIAALHDDPKLRQHMSRWGRLWVENEFSYQAVYQRWFAEARRVGLIDELGIPPKVKFFSTSVAPPQVKYLEPVAAAPSAPAPQPVFAGGEDFTTLQSRIASLEAERDSLRMSYYGVTQTRLWRMVAWAYRYYQQIMNSRFVPGFVRRGIAAMAGWLSHRSQP